MVLVGTTSNLAKEENSALVPMNMLSLNSHHSQSKTIKSFYAFPWTWRKHWNKEHRSYEKLTNYPEHLEMSIKIAKSFAGVEWCDLYELNTSPGGNAAFPRNTSLPFALLFIHQTAWSLTLFIWVLKKDSREGSEDGLKGFLWGELSHQTMNVSL